MTGLPTLQQELDRKANVQLTELVQHIKMKSMHKAKIIIKAETIWACYSGLITNDNEFMLICEAIIEEAKAL